jgi:hypothetical protein
MLDSAPFISSCSRRELARRRLSRPYPQAQMLLVLALMLLGIAAFFVIRGGI